MFVLVVEHSGNRERRVFDKDSITIGRSRTNDVTLPDANVSRRHARISRIAGVFYVEDLGSGNGTRVNDGDPIAQMTPFARVDRINICHFQLAVEVPDANDEITVERVRPDLEPTEAQLVDAMLVGYDDDARLVYADWLEGHGMIAQAEYLRLEEQILAEPNSPLRAGLETKLREVAPQTPLSWRRGLARRLVEPCSLAHWPDCPREWPRLRSTGSEEVRFCGTCDRDVFYCLSIDEARNHIRSDQRVAVDASVPRTPGDVLPPVPALQRR